LINYFPWITFNPSLKTFSLFLPPDVCLILRFLFLPFASFHSFLVNDILDLYFFQFSFLFMNLILILVFLPTCTISFHFEFKCWYFPKMIWLFSLPWGLLLKFEWGNGPILVTYWRDFTSHKMHGFLYLNEHSWSS
jgi:hypothetical protein